MDNANELFERRPTVPVRCGSVTIGGGAPVSVQTMTKVDTRDVGATVAQIEEVVAAGAEIVRVAVPDKEAAAAFREIRKKVRCPLVADIHFDYALAIDCLEGGADKVRVNPGNLGGVDKLIAVASKAAECGAAVRIGVNSGSVEKDILQKCGGPTPEAMVQSAWRSLLALEDRTTAGIVVSLKSSSVRDTVRAYALMSEKTSWPLHVGVTEAGPGLSGITKSASGIAALLALGIGDTIRVSLTGSPVEEVKAGRLILQAAGVRAFGPDIVSCPTCGRTQVDLVPICEEVSRRLSGCPCPIKVAIMGCPVNGPGEAREADVGIACGRDGGVLFSRGEVVRAVPADEIVDGLMALVEDEISRRRRE